MEKRKKLDYVSPQVKVTQVILEQGIANVAVSAAAYLGGDWIDVNDPVGLDTNLEGGDIVLSW